MYKEAEKTYFSGEFLEAKFDKRHVLKISTIET